MIFTAAAPLGTVTELRTAPPASVTVISSELIIAPFDLDIDNDAIFLRLSPGYEESEGEDD